MKWLQFMVTMKCRVETENFDKIVCILIVEVIHSQEMSNAFLTCLFRFLFYEPFPHLINENVLILNVYDFSYRNVDN